MCSAEPLNCSLSALGTDRVMFGADYPFEHAEEAGQFIDNVAIDQKVREDICWNNAVRVLGLKN
jgi:2,3-dihydroxybenzoate decarboxylase